METLPCTCAVMIKNLANLGKFLLAGITVAVIGLYVGVTDTAVEVSDQKNAPATIGGLDGNRRPPGIAISTTSGAVSAGANVRAGSAIGAASNLGGEIGGGKNKSDLAASVRNQSSRGGISLRAEPRTLADARTQSARERMEPYFDRAGLTEDERTRTVEALIDADVSILEIAATARKEGLNAPELAKTSKGILTETEARLAEFLGVDRASEVMALKNSSTLRATVVEDLARRCEASGMPISAKTADDLGALLRQAVVVLPISGEAPISQDIYAQRTMRDPIGIAAAQKILTPQQIALLKNSLAARFTVKN